MNEDTMDMKIDRGSMIRIKSSPMTRLRLKTISPPPTANGMRVMGSTTVTAPSRTDHRERKVLETRLARGIVSEPRIGTRTVRRVMVSIFMRQVIYWPISEKSRISHSPILRLFSSFSQGFPPAETSESAILEVFS